MFPEAKAITKEQQNVNPRKMLIISHPKTGKTELTMQLEDSLYIDLEDSTDFYKGPAKVFNVISNYNEFAKGKEKAPPYEMYAAKYLHSLVAKAKKEGPLCKYLVIDTATALEEIAEVVATYKYKATPIGSSFKEDTILTMAHGGGYLHLRNMFKSLYKQLAPVYSECLIILAHPKDSSVVLDGKDLQVVDLNLTGRLKQIVTGDMDTMAFMFRKKGENVNILNFKTTQKDVVSGSRCPHLKGKQIEISKLEENGSLTTHWDEIFIK
jgi:hypothetical protein